MSASVPRPPRVRHPELEQDHARNPSLGYESPKSNGLIHCFEHGFPTPLARWHYHDEYELHLIVASWGRVFIGDYIGTFQPGHLVLTGPRLPHNWLSTDFPGQGIARRDLVIQFSHEPLLKASLHLSELKEVLPFLDRARGGIEFFGFSDRASTFWHRLKSQQGLARFSGFCQLLGELIRWPEYRILSHQPLKLDENDQQRCRIHDLINSLGRNLIESRSTESLAAEFDLTPQQFLRLFRQTVGENFSLFVNKLRVQRACELLMDSDKRIGDIGHEAGFNNIANFNRRFFQLKAMKPSEFRRQANTRFGLDHLHRPH
jgi:AraC-like DNA-binding protein